MSEESEASAGEAHLPEARQLATEIRVQVWGLRARTREFKEAIAMAQAPAPAETSRTDGEAG